jgi:hypothetical protein
MASLINYFRNGRSEDALEASGEYFSKQKLSISDRAALYVLTQTSFDAEKAQEERLAAFEQVNTALRATWKVSRTSTAPVWTAEQTFNMLTTRCDCCSREKLSLMNIEERRGPTLVMSALSAMEGIKPGREYPHMPAAKFLHFFNPTLFPIYDNETMWKQVCRGAFKSDWHRVCQDTGILLGETSSRFYHTYTRWAGELVRSADNDLMASFAEWFKTQDNGVSAEANLKLETYYAAAFECIAVGAMVIENR